MNKNIKRILTVTGLSLLISAGTTFCVYACMPTDDKLNMNTYNPGQGGVIPSNYNKPGNGGKQNTLPELPECSDSSENPIEIVTESSCLHEDTFTEHEIVEHATCQDPGSYVEKVRCSICFSVIHSTDETMLSSGQYHDLVLIPACDPVCEGTGNIEYYECKLCQEIFFKDFVEIKDPDSVIIPETGHKWSEWTVTKQATCTDEGQKTRKCLNDPSHVETSIIPASGHDHGPEVEENVTEPQLIHDGSVDKVVYCNVCKKELKRQTVKIPAKLKPYEDNINSLAPLESELILQGNPEKPEDLNNPDWEVTVKPTCETAGVRTRYYNGRKHEEVIAALGHYWGEWVVTIEPDIGAEGEAECVCMHDESHVQIRKIPGLTVEEYLRQKSCGIVRIQDPDSGYDPERQRPMGQTGSELSSTAEEKEGNEGAVILGQ